MNQEFQKLTQEQKVDFFVKCQQLMVNHHPNSPMIIREDTLARALDSCAGNIQKYQGFSYSDDNVCVLWNYIYVADPKDVKRAVTENAYRPPNANFNAVSIDFAVFRKMDDCLEFINQNKNDRIQHVLFIREGNPRLYPVNALIKSVV